MQNETSAKRFALPLFLNHKNKYVAMLIVSALSYITYTIPNKHYTRTPMLLTMTGLDQAVPFIPHFIWIYVTEIPMFIVAYFLCQNMKNANKYLYSFFFLQVVSGTIFWFWPTIYPRELFPLPETLDSATFAVFTKMRELDAPTNCLPSLHVSSVYLSSFIYLDDQRRKFPFFVIWATLIAISTLPTKQHYIVDVVAGLALGIFTYWLFHKVVPYRETEAANQ